MYGTPVMPPFVDSIPTPTPETAQSQAADAALATSRPSSPSTPSLCLSVSSSLPPSASQLLPSALFAQFVISALTTLEELSRTSPPNASERRRAATTLLRYLLGPGPRAPRPPSGPRAPRADSSATGFSAVLGGDTRATHPSSSPSTPRAPRADDPAPLTTSKPEEGTEETCKASSAPKLLHASQLQHATTEPCQSPPQTTNAHSAPTPSLRLSISSSLPPSVVKPPSISAHSASSAVSAFSPPDSAQSLLPSFHPP